MFSFENELTYGAVDADEQEYMSSGLESVSKPTRIDSHKPNHLSISWKVIHGDGTSI